MHYLLLILGTNLGMNLIMKGKKNPQYPWIKFSCFNYSVSFPTHIQKTVASDYNRFSSHNCKVLFIYFPIFLCKCSSPFHLPPISFLTCILENKVLKP